MKRTKKKNDRDPRGNMKLEREALRRTEENGGLCNSRQSFEWEELTLFKEKGIMERSMVQKM